MLKLVRNTLGDEIILVINEDTIQLSHLISLQNIQ